jgi:hypothetical protein
MGVRQWMQRQKFNDPVPGTFEVRTCDQGKLTGAQVNLDASGVLSAPGLNPLPAEFHGKAPHAKRPIVGDVLPVVVDRADPSQFRIEWDQMPTAAERVEVGSAVTHERASTAPVNPGFDTNNITVTGGDLSSLSPEAQQQVQSLLGNLGQVLQQGLAGGNADTVVEQPQVTVDGEPGTVHPPHAHTPAPGWDQATATVLTCHNAKVPAIAVNQAPGGIVDLTLDVLLADGYEYSTKTRVAFSTLERHAKATEKGTELPVRVDPADPNRVVIDIDRIPNW